MKTIIFLGAARRAWRGIPETARLRLDTALRDFARDGRGDVKKLKGRPGWRLRWGDYRVVFIEVDGAIEVQSVGHRKDVYE